jgi:anti-sigma factor RsiW
MKCSDYIGWISRKLDGSLPEDQLTELDRHLAICGRCRAELVLQRRVVESLGEEPPSGLPPDFTHRVLERVSRTSRREGRAWRWPALVPAFVSAACAVLVLVFRTGLAEVVAPPMERFSAGVSNPIESAGRSISAVFASLPDLASKQVTIAHGVSPIPVTVVVAAAVACLAVIIAFYEASTLLED